MALTCVLVLVSGTLRVWRDRQFQSLDDVSSACPFPLQELKRSLGTWRSDEKNDGTLDPEIARIAGSSDHIIRVYVDEKSGEKITALVLYGLARSVHGHIPEVCYPASGFKPFGPPINLQLERLPKVKCRKGFYAKNGGESGPLEEVCYSFLHNGEWLPDVSDRWKMFRQEPGIFKVQLHRRVSSVSSDQHPTENLLALIVDDIAAHVAAAKSSQATVDRKVVATGR